MPRCHRASPNAPPLTGPAVRPSPSAAARRMQLHRLRRQRKLRCLTIELRVTEVGALVQRGYLNPERQNDLKAIRSALHCILDRALG
jgi:hypothetical protein